MIAYELNESEQTEAVREHLKECAECAAMDASVAETLEIFAEVPVPLAEFERNWERVRSRLDSSPAIHFADEREVGGGVWSSLWSGLRDALFPKKLPELVLESKPLAVVDRMAVRRDFRGLAGALVIEAFAILLIGVVIAQKVTKIMAPPSRLTEVLTPPPPAPQKKDLMAGGGGQKGPTPVTKGNIPPKMPMPPVPKIEQPKIPMQATIDLDKSITMPTVNMPNFGDPRSPLVGSSMGSGTGGGIGSGNGGGLGAGGGGNAGGGLRHVGGGVSAPSVLTSVEPEFSEEARKAKFAGNVLVYLIVDAQGHPQNVHVIKPVGMGLDQRAVDAVKQYRFRPAMEGGKPVPVELSIEVDFQIF